jgi:O-antigen/teichoic acid export membrane protein
MDKKKLLFENLFIYGLIGIISKVIPLIFLPIITRLLPNPASFGVYGIYTSVVGFGTPLAVMGLYDAMFREYFEKDSINYKYNVTKTTLVLILFSSIIIMSILLTFSKPLSIVFFNNIQSTIIFYLAALGILTGSLISILQAPTRMQNQKKIFIFSSLISSLVMYALVILFIELGFTFESLIYSSLITSILQIVFFGFINWKYFTKGKFDSKIAEELFKIGLPLVPSFLIYWIYNSLDKVMINSILGTFEVGLYSIGARIAVFSQLIYIGFSGGWQYFAFSQLKDKNQIYINSKVFEYLGIISISSFVIIYPFIRMLFSFIFDGDYVNGYIVAPYLYLSPLLLMLFQIAGNQYLVVKKSYLTTMVLAVGAILNIILNLYLINSIGIEGAAIATLSGYYLTITIVIIKTKRDKLMFYSKKAVLNILIVPLYLIVQRTIFHNQFTLQLSFMLIVMISIFVIYFKNIKYNIIVFLKKFKSVN